MNRSDRWQRTTETPLIAAALVFLVAYAVPIAWPSAPPGIRTACDVIVVLTWCAFGLDYLIRLALAETGWRFVRDNLVDLLLLVLPLLRPLRLLRLLTVLSVLNRNSAITLRGKVVVYATGGAMLLLVCAGLAVTEEERGVAGATIDGLGDGLWWAVTTMTTVGYGDRFPVTVTGRIIAVALMVGGIALLGVITATLASWMVARVAEAGEEEQAVTRSHIDALSAQIAALHAEVRRLRDDDSAARSVDLGGVDDARPLGSTT